MSGYLDLAIRSERAALLDICAQANKHGRRNDKAERALAMLDIEAENKEDRRAATQRRTEANTPW